MKKQFTIPHGGSISKSSTVSNPSGSSRPASGCSASLTSARPLAAASSSSAGRPQMVRLTAGSAANKSVKKQNKPQVKPARIYIKY